MNFWASITPFAGLVRRVAGTTACALAFGSVPNLPANELGLPTVDAFWLGDYIEHDRNWCAVQDRKGLLYVGNRNAVLSFDGHHWRSLPTGGQFVRHLAVDADDRIWVAAVGEIGWLETDGRGSRTYVSLREQLPVADRGTLDFYAVHPLPHGVYFVASDRIFRWHNQQLTLVREIIARTWTTGSTLFVHEPGHPVSSFDGTAWREVTATTALPEDELPFAGARAQGDMLLVTENHGVFQLRDGDVSPWPTEVDATLRRFGVRDGLLMRDGSLALLLRQWAVVIVDPTGKFLHYLAGANEALPFALTYSVATDRSGNLWTMQNAGVARLDWPITATFFDRRLGLGTGGARAIARHRGRLYVGTRERLCVLLPSRADTLPPTTARFEEVPGFEQPVRALATAGNDLLVGGPEGLRVLGGASDSPLALGSVLSILVPHDDPATAWIGTDRQLIRLHRRNDGWQISATLTEIDAPVRSLTAEAGGAIRAVTDSGKHFRITAQTFPVENQATHWVASPQIAPDLPHIGEVLAIDPDGGRWEMSSREPATPLGPAGLLTRIAADGQHHTLPLALVEAAGEEPVVLIESSASGQVLWLGGVNGLVRANIPAAWLKPKTFRTVIREAQSEHHGPLPLAAGGAVALPFDHRGIAFVFSTDRLDARGMRYQTRLEVLDPAWSQASATNSLSFNYLPPGRHVFSVRSIDLENRPGEPARFEFAILAPWWRTWWAQLLAVGGSLGLVGLGISWRLRAVRQRNRELENLVAQRTAALRQNEIQLVEARDAAETANRAKSSFLAAMSHELRTPLNAILGFTQVLDRESGLSPKGRAQLAIINRNGRHLLETINEVLDISRIEADKITLQPVPCTLARLLSDLTDLLEPRAAAKHLTLRVELGPDLPRRVLVDITRLRQILINLLGNAIKFTARGEIALRCLAAPGDRTRFEITDTGPGISPSDQQRIFLPFQQAEATSRQAGSGLGLAISQRLVELMGGCIQVSSTPGVGSCFSFELDLPVAHHDSAPPLPSHAVTGYRGPRRHLLIVDDEAANLEILVEFLQPLGFILHTVTDTAGADAKITSHTFDAVLLDLRMPGEDGLTFVRRHLQEHLETAPPFIAVTASVFEADRHQAIDAGCRDFLAKPVSYDALLACLRDNLSLDWIVSPTALSREETPAYETLTPRPAVAVCQTLLDAVRGGDLAAFIDQLDTLPLAELDPRTARHLKTLAREFNTAALRRWLAPQD